MKKNNLVFFISFFFICFFLFNCRKDSIIYLRNYNDIQKVYNEQKSSRAKLFCNKVITTENRDEKSRYLEFLQRIITENETKRKQRATKENNSAEMQETSFILEFIKTNYTKERDFNIKNIHLSLLSAKSTFLEENLSFLISLLKNITVKKDDFYHYQYLIQLLFVKNKKYLIKENQIQLNFVKEVSNNIEKIKKVARQKDISFFLSESEKLEPKDFITSLKEYSNN